MEHKFFLETTSRLTEWERHMLDRVLSPIAQALLAEIGPELRRLGEEINSANKAAAEGADRNKELEQEVSSLLSEVRIVRTAHDLTIIERDKLQGLVQSCEGERLRLQGEAAKWENEALELIATTDETLAKVREERDFMRVERDDLQESLNKIRSSQQNELDNMQDQLEELQDQRGHLVNKLTAIQQVLDKIN
jgi:predicted  nucleic acid-binding Zn-ribbon protein